MSFARFGFPLALALLAAGPLHVRAHEHASEQDEARQAVQSGAIRPLSEILSRLPPGAAAEIVRVKLKRAEGRWVYEMRRMDAQGRLSEIVVDAASGEEIKDDGD